MAKSKTEEATDTATEPKRRRGRQPLPTVIDEATGEEIKVRPVKHPIPDGWDLPPDFYTYVSFHGITDAGNQTVYSWVRGANAQPILDKDGNPTFDADGNQKFTTPNQFPCVEHTDGRTIIDRIAAVEWIKNHEATKREREAQKAERAMNSAVRLRNGAVRLCMVMARSAASTRISD